MIESGKHHPDWLGRVTGLVVFFIGVILLVVVFFMTGSLLSVRPGEVPRTPEALPGFAIDLGLRFGRLFLMGFVAGLIAGRGAQLYAAANRQMGE